MIKQILMNGLGLIALTMALSAQDQTGSAEFGTMPQPLSFLVDTEGMEPNVVMSLAWASYERGDLGAALQYAQRVNHTMGNTSSDASYLIGLVMMHEGLHTLAERSFLKALKYAYTNEERADYSMSLAKLYFLMTEYEAMKQRLHDVVFPYHAGDDAAMYQATLTQQWIQARSILQREGLDRVIQMYRWQGLHHVDAVELLALHAYTQDSYEQYAVAVELFLYSAVIQVGVLIEQMMLYDPQYRFHSLEELLQLARLYPEMQEYVERGNIYRTLFLLASSLYAYEQSDVSRIIWNGLRLQSGSSPWLRRASFRFFNPGQDDLHAEIDIMITTIR
ncbi:hypothetical protein PVA45_00545 [Entomospira entomophila]|uniref:Tetratricopeptide repeat protein n=1 Tax=Entomospira entomophila TaxID=2719988 RepID=A0A968G7G4_9SPIO|nr:hypothetical protein [Entomospira entomophilus]NIZ40010.1 hypothetical protein [Entomospira entomophilus]WDI35570.1 hypothetical protein PVA45_00545 [Entomospira entomophilus]